MKPPLSYAFQAFCVFRYFLNYLTISSFCNETGSPPEWDWDGNILSLIFLDIFLKMMIIIIPVY